MAKRKKPRADPVSPAGLVLDTCLCTPFRTYDLLLELGKERTCVGAHANRKAQSLLPELQGPQDWESLPGDDDLTQGFKLAQITKEDGEPVSPSDVRNLASALAKVSGLRTGILGNHANVEPVSP
jgi:hypothetical protein